MATLSEVRVPDIGDFEGIDVIEVLVRPGDKVEPETSLITLESDKATMEVPSPLAGVVKEIKVNVGDKVSEGTLILSLETSDSAPPKATAAGASAKPAAPAASATPSVPTPAPAATVSARTTASQAVAAAPVPPPPPAAGANDSVREQPVYASPSVRRYARELGADLSLVSGSGRKGRILKQDVQRYIQATLTRGASPPGAKPVGAIIDFSKFGPVETRPLTKIQRISGQRLHQSWTSIPHVTQFDEADITDLEEFRLTHKQNAGTDAVKLTLLSFLMKASAAALRAFPAFCASLSHDYNSLIYKKFYNVGFAVDTPEGLVVPVIRDVDNKGLQQLAAELQTLAQKARERKISPAELQGGCFSISSLGHIGGTGFTPIINAPEVAILGVSRAVMKPVWHEDAIKPRLMLPLSLAYDHRVIDGAAAARFARYVCTALADVRELLL